MDIKLEELQEEDLLIGEEVIKPGEHKVAKILVGQLPSSNKIHIRAHVFRSENPGPKMLLLGGVHGDEINGVEIVRQALEKQFFNNLLKGTVIAIPVLNVYGLINFSRDVPDGKICGHGIRRPICLSGQCAGTAVDEHADPAVVRLCRDMGAPRAGAHGQPPGCDQRPGFVHRSGRRLYCAAGLRICASAARRLGIWR